MSADTSQRTPWVSIRARCTARALVVCLMGWLVGPSAWAHKSSDAYLQLDATAHQLTLRWDIALRDLDVALDLDADDDGRLTWREIQAGWARIESYAWARLSVSGCPLHPSGRSLERRSDGAYAVLHATADCTLTGTPQIAYTLFRDIDPTHRGIARIQRAGQPLVLELLDPARASDSDGSDAPNRRDAAAPGAFGQGPWAFAREGVLHILGGYDHVLFLLCLLLPSVLRRTPQGWRAVAHLSEAGWPILGVVSAFTVAHSITLGLAALHVVSMSPAFIEPAIAATIILAALDNVWPIFPVRRVVVTICFGLIHGFGFADVLSELRLPTREFVWALLQFNLGLEFGQLMIVLCVTGVLFGLRRRPQYRTWVVGGGSMAALVLGVLWLIERTANVSWLPI